MEPDIEKEYSTWEGCLAYLGTIHRDNPRREAVLTAMQVIAAALGPTLTPWHMLGRHPLGNFLSNRSPVALDELEWTASALVALSAIPGHQHVLRRLRSADEAEAAWLETRTALRASAAGLDVSMNALAPNNRNHPDLLIRSARESMYVECTRPNPRVAVAANRVDVMELCDPRVTIRLGIVSGGVVDKVLSSRRVETLLPEVHAFQKEAAARGEALEREWEEGRVRLWAAPEGHSAIEGFLARQGGRLFSAAARQEMHPAADLYSMVRRKAKHLPAGHPGLVVVEPPWIDRIASPEHRAEAVGEALIAAPHIVGLLILRQGFAIGQTDAEVRGSNRIVGRRQLRGLLWEEAEFIANPSVGDVGAALALTQAMVEAGPAGAPRPRQQRATS